MNSKKNKNNEPKNKKCETTNNMTPNTKQIIRCPWANPKNPLYIKYHDEEWGVPVHDDQKIFEFLILESFQAGLSWEIVLNKREGFRKAFENFDPKKVSKFSKKDVARLKIDASIIRNEAKIRATINNAQRFLEVQKEFKTFDKYIWGFTKNKTIYNKWKMLKDLPPTSDLSNEITNDLKKRGFKFLGPKVVYAHMQATGMVHDHIINCFRYKKK